MHVFHFCHCRMQTTVGVNKTVAEEITVAGCIYSEVTSISPVFSSVLVFLEQTLIYPVPDISSLKVRIFIDSLPLSPEISGRVAHCVCIFWRDNRTVAAVLADIFQPAGTRILRYVHIGVPFPLCTFIVDGTLHDVLVGFFQPKISLVEVVSVSGFIS